MPESGRDMARKQLVVAAVEQNDVRLIVFVGRRLEDHAVALLDVDHRELQDALLAAAERLPLDSALDGAVEQFQRPDAAWRAAGTLLKDIYLVAKDERGLLLAAAEPDEGEANEVLVDEADVCHGPPRTLRPLRALKRKRPERHNRTRAS